MNIVFELLRFINYLQINEKFVIKNTILFADPYTKSHACVLARWSVIVFRKRSRFASFVTKEFLLEVALVCQRTRLI